MYSTIRGPTRRVMTALDPALIGPVPCRRADPTPRCHSGYRARSVAYANTSSGRRAISMLATIAVISLPPPQLGDLRQPGCRRLLRRDANHPFAEAGGADSKRGVKPV